jgi:putative PIN family toxin of toxin-antitoxin system
MITSEFILNELVEKLTDRFRFSTETANEATSLVESHSEVVEWQPLPGPVCRDSDDDAVLATAMAGRCQTIVTGDKDLLSLGEYAGIDIVSPAVWMEQHAGE